MFRAAGDDPIPGQAVLHPAVRGLKLWVTVVVPEKPDDAHLLRWLCKLPGGKVLTGDELARVRSYLARCGGRAWSETNQWLAADGTWAAVGNFRYHLIRRPDARTTDLFPEVQATTADLSMLGPDARQPLIGQTRDLDLAIENRIPDAGRPDPAQGEPKPWLVDLGESLARVVFEDAGHQARVADAARRLIRTVFHVRPHLRVVPYIDHRPVGRPAEAKAVWSGYSAVVADPKESRYSEPLAAALSRPFGDPAVANAIRACLGKDDQYIVEYMADNFKIAGAANAPTPPALIPDEGTVDDLADLSADDDDTPPKRNRTARPKSDRGTSNQPAEEPPPANDDDDWAGGHRLSYRNSRTGEPPRVTSDARQVRSAPTAAEPGGPTFVTRFAASRGFEWDASAEVYRGRDGRTITPVATPFKWEWRDHQGTLVQRLWFAEQTLARGVEMATGIWEAIRASPGNTAVVVLGVDDTPEFVPGQTLLRMVSARTVQILPSTYKLQSGTVDR